MWYNDIPELSLSVWLADLVQLFDDTLDAVMVLPVLLFLLVFLLSLVVIGFFALLIRQGRKGRI